MNGPAVPFYPLKFCEMNFHSSTISAQNYTYCIVTEQVGRFCTVALNFIALFISAFLTKLKVIVE